MGFRSGKVVSHTQSSILCMKQVTELLPTSEKYSLILTRKVSNPSG